MLTIRKQGDDRFVLYVGEMPAISFGPIVADLLRPHLPDNDPDLPPGVFREPGTNRLLVRGGNAPETGTLHYTDDGQRSTHTLGVQDASRIYEWRPDPEPATETIPWHEAGGRTLSDGRTVTSVHQYEGTRSYVIADRAVIYAETVEVLAR